MPNNKRKLRVFLCHASQDKPIVRELYQRLLAESWIDPWLDKEKLLPGQDWELEIEKSVESADVVIVCLSKSSVEKEGYYQKEIKKILDVADEKPEGTIFVIPLRLDECSVPRRLAKRHYEDYFPVEKRPLAYERVLMGVRQRAEKLGINADIEYRKFLANGNIVYCYSEIEFVQIPASNFLMGSNRNTSSHDGYPRHQVDIKYNYLIGRNPISEIQFSQFARDVGKPHNMGKFENHPVVNVDFTDANEYCIWLDKRIQHKYKLPGRLILRLPTEGEWEKAARGLDGREWPWGNEFDENNCNTSESGKKETTKIGSFSPQGDSPFDCTDMAGNVLEWTHSNFMSYPYNITYERETGLAGQRVLRGGSFNENRNVARCAYRLAEYPRFYSESIGFRVVLAPSLSFVADSMFSNKTEY